MIYKKVTGRAGNRYLADNRFISRDKIPVDILVKLDKTSEVKFDGCIFCGGEATHKRVVNEVSVALCNDDYYSRTIGRIAQQLREGKENQDVHETTSIRSPA